MSTSDSYVYPPRPSSASSSNSSLDSLPSSLTSDELDDAAQREWEASLQQLELILTMVLVPYLGKYFGRKCAYWGISPCFSTRATSQIPHAFWISILS